MRLNPTISLQTLAILPPCLFFPVNILFFSLDGRDVLVMLVIYSVSSLFAAMTRDAFIVVFGAVPGIVVSMFTNSYSSSYDPYLHVLFMLYIIPYWVVGFPVWCIIKLIDRHQYKKAQARFKNLRIW